MQITFLGTSSGVPTRSRNVSGVALRLPQRAEWWLFDCGEGTQHQIIKSELRISQLSRIFITHMHGDHIYGLMGLLATCGLAGSGRQIDIYGPPELAGYLRDNQRYSQTDFTERMAVHAVENGTVVYEDEEFSVTCRLLKHRVPAFGFGIVERDPPGSFDAALAASLGIPAGPLYGKLKRGERVTLADGRVIDGAMLCAPPARGRRIAYCTDTMRSESAIELARGADVLIHEATFADEESALAQQSMHSTATVAAGIAAAAQVKLLILTHFSARYAPGNPLAPADLLRQARAIFPNTELAYDFLTLNVPRSARLA